MKPKVNKEICIGCGSCAAIASEVFTMKDGKAEVTSSCDCVDCDCAGSGELINQAKDACPVSAITVE